MTDEEKKLLSTFEARLRHLIYLHDELKRENAELKQLLEAKKEEYEKALLPFAGLSLSYRSYILFLLFIQQSDAFIDFTH